MTVAFCPLDSRIAHIGVCVDDELELEYDDPELDREDPELDHDDVELLEDER